LDELQEKNIKLFSILEKNFCNALSLKEHRESVKGTGKGKGTSYTLKNRNWKSTAFSIIPGKGNWKNTAFSITPGKGN
jgi:hypothetical protein